MNERSHSHNYCWTKQQQLSDTDYGEERESVYMWKRDYGLSVRQNGWMSIYEKEDANLHGKKKERDLLCIDFEFFAIIWKTIRKYLSFYVFQKAVLIFNNMLHANSLWVWFNVNIRFFCLSYKWNFSFSFVTPLESGLCKNDMWWWLDIMDECIVWWQGTSKHVE